MARVILFLAASSAIVTLSWRSLKDPRSHGFYRFFAFELLAGLILWNAPLWLRDPFSLRQLLSYFFGAVSVALAIEGFRLLHVIGRPSRTAAAGANLAFENTTALVSIGAYRFIRHPLYASLLALVCCGYLKDPLSLPCIVMAVSAAAFLIATALAEERENVARFGAVYADYMKHTRRFIPLLL